MQKYTVDVISEATDRFEPTPVKEVFLRSGGLLVDCYTFKYLIGFDTFIDEADVEEQKSLEGIDELEYLLNHKARIEDRKESLDYDPHFGNLVYSVTRPDEVIPFALKDEVWDE